MHYTHLHNTNTIRICFDLCTLIGGTLSCFNQSPQTRPWYLLSFKRRVTLSYHLSTFYAFLFFLTLLRAMSTVCSILLPYLWDVMGIKMHWHENMQIALRHWYPLTFFFIWTFKETTLAECQVVRLSWGDLLSFDFFLSVLILILRTSVSIFLFYSVHISYL